MAHALDPNGLGRHVDRLYHAAWAMTGNREDAEDLVQETFALVLARPRKLRNSQDVAYLLGVLRNAFVSDRRRAMRRVEADPTTDPDTQLDPRAANRPEEAVLQREVFTAIAELPDDQRDALVAVDIAGLSYQEAADLLGAKAGTITTRLHRGRVALRRSVWAAEGVA